ncbi:MAG TPA: hypothetical protein VF950_12555 [Planctomycetota bacterium]
MCPALCLAILVQDKTALGELEKIEAAIRTAKALRVKYSWSQETAYPKISFKMRAAGTLLLRGDGRIRLTSEGISDGNPTSLLVISDGTTLWATNTWMGKPDTKKKKSPANLISAVSKSLTGGVSGLESMLWLALDEEVDAEGIGTWRFPTPDVRDVQDAGDVRVLTYGYKVNTADSSSEVKLRYDPKTYKLLSRSSTAKSGIEDAKENKTYVETFEEFKFDADLPADAFQIPK